MGSPSIFEFYYNLNERWQQLLDSTSASYPSNVPPLTALAKKVLLSHPISRQSLPSVAHSLIKKVLPNGFTIFIQELQNPKEEVPTVSLRLVVKTGHLYESDEEKGLAHLVEHGLFQGTKNLTRKEIEALFQSLGCCTGNLEADANASTDYHTTTYQLDNVSTANGEWKKSLHLFYEFCTSAQFPEEEMLKERDVVADELLGSEGAENDASFHYYSFCFPKSRYVDCYPQQLSEKIQNATGEELREMLLAFYQKWYRPNNMALVVVGNFGDSTFEAKRRNQLIKEIEALFGQIPPHDTVVPSWGPSLDENQRVIAPWQHQLRTSAMVHPDFTHDDLRLCKRIETVKSDRMNKQLAQLGASLFDYFLNQRLIRMRQEEQSPLAAWESSTESIKFTDSSLHIFQIQAIHDRSAEALNLVVRELKRLELHGCDRVQLEVCRKYMRRSMLEMVTQDSLCAFSDMSDRYASYFVTKDETQISLQVHQLFKLFLLDQTSSVDLNQIVQQRAKALASFQQRDLRLILFSSSQTAQATVSQLQVALADSTSFNHVEPFSDLTSDDSWLTTLKDTLSPVAPIKCEYLPTIDTHTWLFPNQIQVTYKLIRSLQSHLSIAFIVPSSLFHMSRHQTLHLSMAMSVLNQIGLKNKTHSELSIAKLNAFIDSMHINQSNDFWTLSFHLQNREGFETALQMLHLRLTDMTPILSEEFERCWRLHIDQFKTTLKKSLESATGKLDQAQKRMRVENHPSLRPISLEELETLNFEEARRFLIQALQEFSQSRLLICGSRMQSEQVEALAAKYVGSLTPRVKMETTPFVPVAFTPRLEVTMEEGEVSNRSEVYFYFPVKKVKNPRLDLHMAVATYLTESYLNQKIRFEQQLNYGIIFESNYVGTALDWRFVHLTLQCETGKMAGLISQIWNTMESLLNLSEEELNNLLRFQKSDYQKLIANEQNTRDYWLDALSTYIKRDYSLDAVGQLQGWIEQMTLQDLRIALAILLERRNESKKLILHPKRKIDDAADHK